MNLYNITRVLVNVVTDLHRKAIFRRCYHADRAAEQSGDRVERQKEVLSYENAHLLALKDAEGTAIKKADEMWAEAQRELNALPQYRPQ